MRSIPTHPNFSLFMKISPSVARRLLALPLAFAASIIMSSCGGGGDELDLGPPTVRPKTLNEVQVGIDGWFNLRFFPDTDIPGAIFNGDIETGAFEYTFLGNGVVDGKAYDNVINQRSNVVYAVSVVSGTYTYQAINDDSGNLTLTGTGTPPLGPPYTVEDAVATNSLLMPFVQSSPAPLFPFPTQVVEMNLAWVETDGNVNVDRVTLSLPQSPVVNTFDTVRIPSSFRLFDGSDIPVNYTGPENPDNYGNVVPATLDGLLLNAINGIPNTAFDFTLQFTATETGLFPGNDFTLPEERGTVLVRVRDAGNTTFVVAALAAPYEWRRIPDGSNTGELTISGIPDNPLLPFDTQLNGSMDLNFPALEAGTYTGNDASTSGDFTTTD